MVLENRVPGTRVLINAPLGGFGKRDRVLLVFYALPNGNTIEQTFGRKQKEGDDWHYDIQHIGAQARFVRQMLKGETLVVAYLESDRRSWPLWKASNPGHTQMTRQLVDEVKALFAPWHPRVVLNGHSGGGRFIFSYLEATEDVPSDIVRIAFLDSNYGYEDTVHGRRLSRWLDSGAKRYLCTLAYNDSVVMYNGKPLVSPTGGTWYRSRMMLRHLRRSFPFAKDENDSLIYYKALKGRVQIIMKKNPEGRIFHTLQVERNGFIHSMLCGTRREGKGYTYMGERAYNRFISDSLVLPLRRMNIPPRQEDAEPGSRFMERIALLPLAEREEEIFKALASGNLPGFLRNTVTLEGLFSDAEGRQHQIVYEVMPDYLAVGSEADFCRIPMNPYTAGRVAALYGASLLTSRMSDHIDKKAEVRLVPFNYPPEGNRNERVEQFTEHNRQIEKQWAESGAARGALTAGIKKDVILSEQIARRPGKVVIYGWHRPDGTPIQPVYSGHAGWYVDYSHGIRLVNNQVLVDGQPFLLSDILKDPVLYRIFSDENVPMEETTYRRKE